MTVNKKLALLFVLFVITPLLLVYINGYIAENEELGWSSQNINTVTTWSFIISIAGCFFIAVLNNKLGYRKSIWYTVPLTLAVGLIFLLYLGTSFSNFGF